MHSSSTLKTGQAGSPAVRTDNVCRHYPMGSATIRAVEKGTAIRVTRKNFEHLAAWEPMLARRVLFDLGKTLAVRLRYLTNKKV